MNPETIISIIALIISFASALLSIWYSRKHYKHEQQVIRAETLMHFTKTYYEIVEASEKPERERVQDPVWLNSYLGLQGSEFYFYHHGTIPAKMYAIWMTDVADLYSRQPKIWDAHIKYLNSYDEVYKEMSMFFKKIYEFSKIDDKETRYKQVSDYVFVWIKKYKAEF